MAGYTCVQCLQVLRQGVRASAPQARLQSLATARRRSPISPSFIRSFGSQRNGRSLGNTPEQPKHTHNQTCCAPKSSPSPLTQRAAHTATGSSVNPRAVLKPDNLFHSFSNSPSPAIRKRAEFIKQNAFCPHPSHQQTRAAVSPHDPEARKTTDDTNLPPAHSHFECPDCGVPVYCSEGHWMDDFEAHLEICDTLRQINEDDHDLHSGRFFHEFHYPGPQDDNFVINMTNWDTYLYTREFAAINDDRSMRQVTRMLTYPRQSAVSCTNLAPLRYTLHPPKAGESIDVKGLRLKAPPYMYPRALLHLIFIGPESMANRDGEYPLPERTPENPFGGIVEDRLGGQMKITTYVDYFHTMNKAQYFGPFDPYLDCFMLFHPGLGHPASSHEWEETLPQLLETKVPIICTGYTQWDLERDINWVGEKCRGEFDVLLEPGENIFRSLRWDLNDQDPHDVSCGNWGLWAFRGKRYEAAFSKEE
ncbi:hypothetical protein N7519_006338 [Penicillium mononematosum]|uniref:uncharacterized protein n=1 Tax=Penicillium mononematosum TaxID=268346 RepID=UPI00254667AF|nr:uncharacterized protein N7519_006338 [Penicillium mononematosum]KAJ6185037.1 hypothetical protein N7519_006338 [Penicillium mononematosum]